MLNSLELTGRASTHVTGVPELAATLHNEAAQAALALREAARVDGLELEVVSSYRDFARQEAIWNGKYQGEHDQGGTDGPERRSPRHCPQYTRASCAGA